MPDLSPMPHVTALYAGLLGLIATVISFMVGRLRGGPDGVSIGDGGRIELIAAMRRHANFVEVVPLALILIGLLEMNRVGDGVIHALGATLVVGRISHAYGFRADGSQAIFRTIGAVLSLLVSVVASVWAISVY